MQVACDNIIAEGFSVNCFLDQIHDVIVAMEPADLSDPQKARVQLQQNVHQPTTTTGVSLGS